MRPTRAFWTAALSRLNTVRVRLTLWYVLLLAAILAAYSAILLVNLSRGLEAGVDRVLNDGLRQAVGIISAVDDVDELQEEFRRINVGTTIGLYDADGQHLIAGRGLPPPFDHPRPPADRNPRLETLVNADGGSWRALVQRANGLGGRTDRLLIVARSSVFIPVAVGELTMLIAVTLPAIVLLAIAVGVFLAGRALDPIDQITRTADVITAEDLSRRLGLRRPNDEIGHLAETFDHMLDRLDRAFEMQRQFTADASHELRTPLSMVVSRSGLALERTRSVDEYQTILKAIRDDGLHMGRIVNDLLVLARADAGEAIAIRESLDPADLAQSTVEAMAPLAEDRGIALRAVCDGSCVVVGDQTPLTQLLVNLVDNAIRHTPPGGEVVVSTAVDASDAGVVVIRVADTGTGIAPEQLPHVFKRFFRGDRDRRRERGGAGLGLSLCQAIVHAHGGEISVASEPGKGTLVTVRLPRHASASAVVTSPPLHVGVRE